MALPEHYATLGVAPGVTPEELRTAYMELARKHHPDVEGGDPVLFKGITAAYAVLKDPARRIQYDAARALLRPGCAACQGTGRKAKTRKFRFVGWEDCPECGGKG